METLKRHWILAVGAILAVSIMSGCGPQEQSQDSWEETGEHAPKTERILMKASDAPVTQVELKFGAADFRLRTSRAAALIEGTVRYRSEDLRPRVDEGYGYARVYQRVDGISVPDTWRSDWDIALSARRAIELEIHAGAFKGYFDFSGLRLRRLTMKTGAAEGDIRFDRRNPEVLSDLDLTTGASSFRINGLLNANFEDLSFEGGAGSYLLNFGGRAARPCHARVSAGVCDLTIEIPRDVPAKVVVRGALTAVSRGSFLVASTREYVNEAYRRGGNTLEITVQMGLGNITLREIP